MTDADRHHWEARYASGDAPINARPNRWLARQAAYLDALAAACVCMPQALDIACGAGGTVAWLAQRGWQVTGVDISPTALALAGAQLAALAPQAHATLEQADLDSWRPAANSCDLLTCFNFLERQLWPAMRLAVRPRGLIGLRTFHTGRLAERPGTNPVHLLAPGELRALVEGWGWRVLVTESDAQVEAVLAQRLKV
ncbi:MAG: class I SAM-dependent methyltransferase [Caldilineaceae bacterium]